MEASDEPREHARRQRPLRRYRPGAAALADETGLLTADSGGEDVLATLLRVRIRAREELEGLPDVVVHGFPSLTSAPHEVRPGRAGCAAGTRGEEGTAVWIL